MKTFVVVLGLSVFVTGSFAQAPMRIDIAPDPQAKKDEAKKPDAKKDDAKKKKEEPPPKIEGIIIAREGGRLLAIRIVDGVFRLSFYDEKKKGMPPDFPRAALRWKPKDRLAEDHALLTPGGDDHSLTSEKAIRPPWNFKLTIALLKDAGDGNDAVGETYVIDFAQ